ncbi:hypothetical protein [Proteiniborus sp. MB09-C3]|uniref:hypothetical protein n=1 Tax=Proteiniborus sp. MB09-C3 TaxID=3050072 RepID=UPI0025578F72|nr:hypothetical protein [Proteiniborus sp. MB09-C3]WIV11091.1 hypothetical protein QO263_13145 [Proteiniborus sp. MB09-C3]
MYQEYNNIFHFELSILGCQPTDEEFDDLFIYFAQYTDDFEVIYYSPKERLTYLMREYKNAYEIYIAGIKKLDKKFNDV